MRFIHIILLLTLFCSTGCVKETFKGSGDYKKTKESEKSDNYLESQADDVVDKSEKRNEKLDKKKRSANERAKQEEIDKAEAAKKDKKKKKNTGKFHFY